ncbi:hypothetical protein [Mycobacterium kyogaense]|uniref:hypothetical protein n=1 Tax=Mycobacterium kyogaense TaxID=2212479 RepID=UPI000DAF253F|nr:hypothetical protein [Mycobacterium kyogaense]
MASTSTQTRKTTTTRADVVNQETGQTADEVKTQYVGIAEGRGGRVNRRKTGTTACAFAVDVADPEAKSAAGKAGLIWSFHATEAQADAAAERYRSKGLDAVVVPAESAPLT